MFERKSFLVLWFLGWFITALNYTFGAYSPVIIKQNRLLFLISLCSYFFGNFLISCGTFQFLQIKARKAQFLGIGILWFTLFSVISALHLQDLAMIQFTNVSVFVLVSIMGIVMIMSAKKSGKFIMLLGLLNIGWVVNTFLFTIIFNMPYLAPFVISQIILLLNAVGMILLYFKKQNETIREGLEYITHLTVHDGLTGLYNKSYFDNKLQEVDKDKKCLPVSLIIGDMNGLKFVNDVYGHHEGDSRLREIALLIRQCCREKDIVARWGGDEFAILLPNTDKETVHEIRDKISQACNGFQGKDFLCSLSLGVATKTDAGTSLTMTLKEAEDLMYQAKLTESRKVRKAISETLDIALQEYDFEMKGHIERLRMLAEDFARVLGFSAENLDTLKQAATLHDIGIIGLSKEIVQKEPVLDDENWPALRKHVEIGYRIAQASGEFAHLADIILYHHEWWNGEGYPHGLVGEEIPYMSRIIAIIDEFDVMTHGQLSNPAMTGEEALLELSRQAGSRFDPTLVQNFTRMMREKHASGV